MKIKFFAVIVASGLALASTLVEARGPGGGHSMGGGYGSAPAQTQYGNMSPGRAQDQERTRTQDQERTRTQDQERTRTQDQERIRSQDQERIRSQDQERVQGR